LSAQWQWGQWEQWGGTTHAPPELPAGCAPLAIGLDVLSLSRLSAVLQRSPRLFRRVCGPQERLEWTGEAGGALAWSAALWVTKEASVKCLGTGFWRQGVDWPDLNVGGHRAQELERTGEQKSADGVWAGWRAWGEVMVSDALKEQLEGARVMTCARLESGVAWGFAYLVAPDRH